MIISQPASIVPNSKIQKDVTKLPFHFPSFPLVKYCKLSAEYHFWKAVRMLEQAVQQNGKILVPTSCLHWKRKKQFQGNILHVYGRSFYQLAPEELSRAERTKYDQVVASIEEDVTAYA
jgi:hypothetical protein